MPEFINANLETEQLPDTIEDGSGNVYDVIIYNLPVYWASYLINGCPDSLEDGERGEIDAYLESEGHPCFVDCGPSHFSRGNDATNLGGNVCEYVAHVWRVCEDIHGSIWRSVAVDGQTHYEWRETNNDNSQWKRHPTDKVPGSIIDELRR